MSFDPTKLARPEILQLKPYQPGKPISEVQQEYGLAEVVKLASNENPQGCSPRLNASLTSAFADIMRYPDGSSFALKAALAKHWQISEQQLLMGNGSEDVLRMLLQTFVFGDKHLIISQYGFIAYRILAQGLGITVNTVAEREFQTDLEAIANAVTPQTGMIILANPNNPTGTYVTQNALSAFLDRIPAHVFVVCDEAYYEYVSEKDYPQTLALQAQHPNLIVTRTFSKAYGLAGLRIGYGIANETVVDLVNRIRQPFNVNHLGQVAATVALADQAFVQQGILLNEQGKQQLYTGLTALGVHYLPSVANFILVELKQPGCEIFQALLKKGIIVRPLEPYQLSNYVRISIGTEIENKQCLKALAVVLAKEVVA